jgi:hypothetical protein
MIPGLDLLELRVARPERSASGRWRVPLLSAHAREFVEH